MRRAQLQAGDTVEVRVRGTTFEAVIREIGDGMVAIEPKAPWATWRRVRLSQVVRRIDPPPRKHRRVAA